MKRKRSRLLAVLLAAVMALSSNAAFAAGNGKTGEVPQSETAADPSTLTSWESVFGSDTLSTKDVGRIWNDKTVSTESITLTGDIGEVTIDKAEGADFQVALSALGSAAEITDTTKVPTDTVFVLDLSNNMWDDIDTMIDAANGAIKTLMNANPQNRVAVVGYSTKSTVLLPLGHYLPGSNFLTVSGDTLTMSATQNDADGTQVTSTFNRITNSHKYTQRGIYEGMNILMSADTTAVVGDTTVSRSPVLILMAEGEAKVGSETFTAPPENYTIGEDGLRDTSRYAQSWAAAMTAAYMKEQVTEHYYGDGGESARVYTMGVDIADSDAPALAYAYLDPAQTVAENFEETGGNKQDPTASWTLDYFKEKFNDYNTGGKATIHTGSAAAGLTGWGQTDITKAQNGDAVVETFEYDDQYYDVTNANWEEIFSQIADDVSHQVPSMPTNAGAEGTGGGSGKLVFTDRLGAYMEVTGLPTIVFAGKKYQAAGTSEADGTTVYTFAGEVTGNAVYGSGNLSDIKLTVTQDGDRQTLVWEIPANLLPLRTMKADSHTDAEGKTSYTIQEENPAYPIRLFYSVEKTEVPFDEEDNAYLLANTVEGKTSYYAATWDEENDRGDTTAVFTPAASNSFYHYTEDTPLYVLQASDGTVLTAAQAAGDYDTINPGLTQIQVGRKTYSLTRAATYNENYAYYYSHTYYQASGTGDAAEKLTDYHRVQNTANMPGNTKTDDSGRLYVKAGVNKLSRVSDIKVGKEENRTDTASTCRAPEYTLAENATVTIYLGNNGRLQEDAPAGTLSVKLEPSVGDGADHEQKFEYTIGLFGQNGETPEGEPNYVGLNGEYSYTVKGPEEEELSSGSLKNGGKITLGENETLEITGLPAGTAWQLTQGREGAAANYSPVYSGDGTEGAKHTGQLLYVGKDDAAELDKSVTVQNTYDATQVNYTYRYDANAITGSASNPGPGGSAKGGAAVPLSKNMTHEAVDGKAVVFLGWYDGDKNDVNQIYGKDNQADFAEIKEAKITEEGGRARFYRTPDNAETAFTFTMPARSVTLYAVWGYDENNDGKADAEEETYTLTYDANGGYFGGEPETAVKQVENVLAQETYPLDISEGNIPARAEGQGGTKYAFIAWSETEDDHIYTFGESYVGTSSVEIKEDTTVYAVWGVDTDGDGTADIQEGSFTITANAGEGGSIAPAGPVAVMTGQKQSFIVTPNQGKAVDTITVETLDTTGEKVLKTETYVNDGKSALPDGQSFTRWTFADVQTHYNIKATFADTTDESGDPIPDKYNRVLTLDGNGGYFDGSQGTTTKTLIKSDGEAILSSVPKPTHEKEIYEGVETDVVFLGWMREDNQEKIYAKGDAAPTLVTSGTVQGDLTLYAAWGYQSAGSGQPDVYETYYRVTTVLTGEGAESGSISPENPLVKKDAAQAFAITAGFGYAVKTIAVDGEIKYTNHDAGSPFGGSWTLEKAEKDCTLTVTFGADSDQNGIPDEYEEPEVAVPNLTEIVAPGAITGVPNGTALETVCLPEKVTIRTTEGDRQAHVAWNIGDAAYDPAKTEEQTFTVNGTVTLPDGVTNTDSLPLTVSISVTVDAKAEVTLTGIRVKQKPERVEYTEGDALALNGLVVTLRYSDETNMDVSFAEFADEGIAVSLADGTTLNTEDTQITVSKGGFSDTFAITVRAMEQAAAPIFSVPGGSYAEGQSVELSTATEGAAIYYTTDGSTPTAESMRYEAPILVDRNMIIKAVAVKEGMKDSPVSSAAYTIQTEPAVTEYTLTVENGAGGGRYAENAEVPIKADAAPEGKIFDKWVSSNGGTFADETNPETIFTMPGNDVTVAAVYKDSFPAEPTEPVTPDESAGSENPEETEPAETEGPAETAPEDVSVPGTPGESDVSTSPEETGTAAESGTSEETPHTGDDSSFFLWIALLGISGIVLTAVVLTEKPRGAKRRK